LSVDDDGDSGRIVVDGRRWLIGCDVAEKKHRPAGHTLWSKGELRIKGAAPNLHQRLEPTTVMRDVRSTLSISYLAHTWRVGFLRLSGADPSVTNQ
jgi:hypothetical protein